MSLETKKLSQLEVLESAEGTHVLVEQGGTHKRVPADKIGGGAGVDVTASVGQTIVVTEVDASGKPTKWEAAEYQPRTHWRENAVLFDGTAEFDANGEFAFMPTTAITVGETYKVTWNGVEYSCKAFDADGWTGLGDFAGESGEPFAVGYNPAVGGIAFANDGATTATMTIEGLAYVPIPAQYLSNAAPYYIAITGSGTDEDPLVCNDTVENVRAIYESGRQLAVKTLTTDGALYIPLVNALQHGQVFGLVFSACVGSGNALFVLAAQEDGTFQVSGSLPE